MTAWVPNCNACDDKGKDPNGCNKCGTLGPAGRAAAKAAARQRGGLTQEGRDKGKATQKENAKGVRGSRGKPVQKKKKNG